MNKSAENSVLNTQIPPLSVENACVFVHIQFRNTPTQPINKPLEFNVGIKKEKKIKGTLMQQK